jgi:choline dehydrogenase-like flavoprotein
MIQNHKENQKMSTKNVDKLYDVVIVGAGIAGAILAKTLVNAGKKVLILEAGDGVTPSEEPNGLELDLQSEQAAYQGYIDRFYRAAAKVPNSPYPNQTAAPSPDVLDIASLRDNQPKTKSGYFVQTGPMPFGSDYARTLGGTTLHWLGTCLRMLPNDFQMKTKYGVGVDWPIFYGNLRPYYEMAEQEIGVSADVEHLEYPNVGPNFFGDDYQFPMREIPTSYLDRTISKALGKLKVKVSDGNGGKTEVEVKITPTPQGRNSTPNAKYQKQPLHWDADRKQLVLGSYDTPKGYTPVGATWDADTGERCEGNASCVPICPVQAKYNALKTLKSVTRKKDGLLNKDVKIINRAVVSEVLVDNSAGGAGSDRLVTGIKYKRYECDSNGKKIAVGDECIAKGKCYVLAAHAVENAKILLASGLANSSGQVGRNLMDHVTFLTWGLKDEPVYPFRGPGSTSNIPVFRDGDFRKEYAACILPLDNWGWGWPKFSPGSDVDDLLDRNVFGEQLKSQLEFKLTRQVLLHFECEQLPEENNQVTIDPRFKDELGNFRPVIRYDVSEYLKKAFAANKEISDEIFKAASIQDFSEYDSSDPCYFEYQGKGYFFRGAGHLVGTHRMGSDRTTSVVNAEQRTWDHSNLYLVGGGNMVTLGTCNPTLTIAALTFWAAENILKTLTE